MSPINTESFIAPASARSSRSVSTSFSTEQSVGETFGEHLRQAFQADASPASSQWRPSDTRQSDQAENSRNAQRGHNREDSAAGDTVADHRDDTSVEESRADVRTDSQDSRCEPKDSQDTTTSSDNQTAADNNGENQDAGDRTKNDNVIATETEQDQSCTDGAELVSQLIAENAQQNQQANLVFQHYADQNLNNTGNEQTSEIGENTSDAGAAIQVAVDPVDAAGVAQMQADVSAESTNIVESPVISEKQNTSENTQNQEQDLEAGLADATSDKTDKTVVDNIIEEASQQTTLAAGTSEETVAGDASAQSQVAAAEHNLQQNSLRNTDNLEANPSDRNSAESKSENGAEADAQAAATTSVINPITSDRDQFKSAQNALDKINASDAADKDSGDAKASSHQHGQNDISIAQRGHNVQDARAAAASAPAGTEDIDTVDRVRFVQRVARAIEGAGRDGGTLRMRLHPSELGSLRLEVTIRDGAMIARMETETQAAKNILLDNLPALRDRLAQQDIKVQQFDIDYAGSNNDGSQQSEADQYQSNDRSADRPATASTAEDAEKTNERTQAVPRARRLGEAAQLDFVA
ncbi:MAG: flagellar hook-length control protein FliK [Pirellulales bacterium]|nr:flagellar hook-length control protein FliK [Pirellulales bacterium]